MRRRVLVTGGSRGLGLACAQRLASDGWQVLVASRTQAAVREAAASLPGEGHEALVLDVADPESWAAAQLHLGRLDGLVHAAGVLGPIGAFDEIDVERFGDVLRVNVTGLLLAVRACASALRASDGAAVAFSGGGATGPFPRFDGYAASKAAAVRLVENLAAEGLRINAVAPGMVATTMQDEVLAAGPLAAGPAYHARVERAVAEGGDDPALAAGLVAFLLSEAPSTVSGRLISARWDPWGEAAFATRLSEDQDLATLRRIDDQFFVHKDRS